MPCVTGRNQQGAGFNDIISGAQEQEYVGRTNEALKALRGRCTKRWYPLPRMSDLQYLAALCTSTKLKKSMSNTYRT